MIVNKNILSERAIGNYFKTLCKERKYKIVKLIPADTRGIPDRMILTRTGVTLYIELKSEGGTLKPMQLRWAEWLEENNFLYLAIDKVTPEMHDVFEEFFNLIDTVEPFAAIPNDAMLALIGLTEMFGKPVSNHAIRRSTKKA